MTASFDPARATLVELCRALHERVISAVELMEYTLRELDRTHESLRAMVSRRSTESLLADARTAEARLDRGEGRPLEGVPLGVKDLEDCAGLPTSYGSRLFEGRVAASDSTQVARLKAAGAIPVGKTNTAEFGFTALTKNLLHGATHSPWDYARSPGGSSGGASALLAAGALPLVTASDGGGSIRIPASFCGAFGLKPTFGRVPTGPAERWDPSALVAFGPLTKTVSDAAMVLDQVAGPDLLDPTTLPAPGFRYLDRLNEPLERPLRLAFSPRFGGIPVQADVLETVERAVAVFGALGHRVTVVDSGPPDLGAYWGFSFARHLDGWIGEELAARSGEVARGIAKAIDTARSLPPAYWGEQARARMSLVRWFAAIFADYDLLLTPTAPCDPPPAKGPLPTEVGGVPLPTAGIASFTMPMSFAGVPAATVRAGRSAAGLPVGLQIAGPRAADDLVLRLARAFERERPWHPDWPIDGLG